MCLSILEATKQHTRDNVRSPWRPDDIASSSRCCFRSFVIAMSSSLRSHIPWLHSTQRCRRNPPEGYLIAMWELFSRETGPHAAVRSYSMWMSKSHWCALFYGLGSFPALCHPHLGGSEKVRWDIATESAEPPSCNSESCIWWWGHKGSRCKEEAVWRRVEEKGGHFW